MLLGQPERVVGPIGADLERVQRKAQVVDGRSGRGEVVDVVDGLLDEVRVDDVDVEVDEALAVADVLDVGERPGLEVVGADDAVRTCEQLVAEVRAEEPRASCYQAGCHAPRGYPSTRTR